MTAVSAVSIAMALLLSLSGSALWAAEDPALAASSRFDEPQNQALASAVAADAEAAADESARTVKGARYVKEVLAAFTRDHGRSVQWCVARVTMLQQPDFTDFRLLLRVDASGAIEQMFAQPATPLALCLSKELEAWRAGVPPRPGTWVGLHVRLTADDWLGAEYLELARQYSGPQRESAVQAIAEWPEEALRREARVLHRLARIAKACSRDAAKDLRCSQIGRWTTAALMLHRDAAERLYQKGRSPELQLSTALAVAAVMKHAPPLRAFLLRWYLAAAADAEDRAALREALDWARMGLREFPESTELRLVVASTHEMAATAVVVRIPDSAFEEPDSARLRRDLLAAGRHQRELLESARRTLLEIVRSTPERLDARVRLGRVEWRLGRTAEARKTLEGVLAASPARADAYLAQLFLGRLQEEEGRLEPAARAYEAATALEPGCQAARLALSNVRLRSGDTAAARRDVEQALSLAGRRPTDPFWLYPWGPSRGAAALLAALRRDASS